MAQAAPIIVRWVTFLALLCAFCEGSNPVVPDVGMADPHVHVFNGKFYMYATHDFSPNNTGFRMDDWWVWSSPDMVTWTKESILTPEQTPAPQNAWHECWATDGAMRNGSYYFYLSIGPAQGKPNSFLFLSATSLLFSFLFILLSVGNRTLCS